MVRVFDAQTNFQILYLPFESLKCEIIQKIRQMFSFPVPPVVDSPPRAIVSMAPSAAAAPAVCAANYYSPSRPSVFGALFVSIEIFRLKIGKSFRSVDQYLA